MKHINLLMLSSISLFTAKSQPSILPSQNNEYCPGTEYTFTATITKAYSSMIGEAGCFITQSPQPPVGTTFTFKGQFGDVNQKQTFRIYHPDNTSTTFDFKKIKSLFYGINCSQVPNQSAINVPRCQIINIPISVPNVQWGTNFESPTLCFGSITDFEYKLPLNWSIGQNISNGNNWISGGNSVTVTSDPSNGINGAILVRPKNNCSNGLQNNQTPGQILISRPEPILSITGTQNYICSGCTNFTINGMPSGASVQWSLSNTVDASISGCSTCNIVSVCRNTSSNTIITLTALVTHCTFSYTQTHDITLGAAKANDIEVILVDPYIGRIQVAVDPPVPGASSYNWYKNGILQNTYHGSFAQIPITKNLCDIWYDISVAVINACGTSIKTYKNVYVPPCNNSFLVAPNPATNSITVVPLESKISSTSDATIDEIKIFNLQGNLKKQQKYNQTLQAIFVISDVPNGVYFIEITSGIKKERQQLIIQK